MPLFGVGLALRWGLYYSGSTRCGFDIVTVGTVAAAVAIAAVAGAYLQLQVIPAAIDESRKAGGTHNPLLKPGHGESETFEWSAWMSVPDTDHTWPSSQPRLEE